MGRAEIGVLAALLTLAAAPARPQQVTLPLARYEELRARATAAPAPAPALPAPFALEADELEIRAGAGAARIVQTLTLTLYAAGWQSVPLGASGSFVAARLGALEGRVVTAGGSPGSSLVVRGGGRHRVELESVLPVTRDETATLPTWKIAFEPPAAAVVRGRLRAPATIDEVTLDEAGTGLARRAADGSWELVAAPGAALRLSLRGRPVRPERMALPLRFEVLSATATVASRTELKVRGWLAARVAQGRLERLTVPLPEGLKPVAVAGPLAGWTVEGGSLAITPLAPVEGTLAVEIELAGPPRDAFASPVLLPAGSARTLLFTRTSLHGDGILDLADPGAARAAEEGEAALLPANFRDEFRDAPGKLLALPDPQRPPRWAIAWAERTEVLAAEVDRLRVDVLLGESGRASYELWAVVRNRGAEQLALTLPADFELAAAARDGVAITPGLIGDGTGRTLAVPLAAVDGEQVVRLRGVLALALPAGGGDLALPLPRLSAPVARVEVRALLPGGRRYALADAARSGGVAEPPTPAVLQPAEPAGGSSGLAQQVHAAIHPAADAPPLPRPPGFVEVDAAWSALSAAPQPLVLRVRLEKERESWF